MIIRCLFVLSALFISVPAQAHQPNLSSIILAEQEEGKWVLQIRSALTAFEYVVEEHFGLSAYATPEEFQELVVNYMRDHIAIQFNGTHPAILRNGMVKLGHETNVVFELAGLPETIKSLSLENKSFKDIARNQSVLAIYKEGFSRNQFTLDNTNNHSVILRAGQAGFEAVERDETWARTYLLLPGILLVVSFFFFFVYQQGWGKKLNVSRFEPT